MKLQLQDQQSEMRAEGNKNYPKTQDFKTSDSEIRDSEFVEI